MHNKTAFPSMTHSVRRRMWDDHPQAGPRIDEAGRAREYGSSTFETFPPARRGHEVAMSMTAARRAGGAALTTLARLSTDRLLCAQGS